MIAVDYVKYRQSPSEQARIADLIRLLPRDRVSVLDIGARDGFISSLLAEYFTDVTALDMVPPQFENGRVVPVQGDVTGLPFADNSFDVVCCLEVLEHIQPGQLPAACREIARVDVSTDGGRSWTTAEVASRDSGWTWCFWEASLDLPPGEHEILCRAFDSAAQTQPAHPAQVWNFKGYANNAWHRVRVVCG